MLICIGCNIVDDVVNTVWLSIKWEELSYVDNFNMNGVVVDGLRISKPVGSCILKYLTDVSVGKEGTYVKLLANCTNNNTELSVVFSAILLILPILLLNTA